MVAAWRSVALLGGPGRSGDYERFLRGATREAQHVAEQTAAYNRDPAFRRVVTSVYDYRCAGS